jgi:hypothetical protein
MLVCNLLVPVGGSMQASWCTCDYPCTQLSAKVWANFEILLHPGVSEFFHFVGIYVIWAPPYAMYGQWSVGAPHAMWRNSRARVRTPAAAALWLSGILYYRARALALALAVSREPELATVYV